MIVYSKIFNSYTDFFLIQYLRQNKWLWDYKFFFEHLSLRDSLVLIKSLLNKNDKTVFVQLEGPHSWRYYRPSTMAKLNFGFRKEKKTVYWTEFFDEVASRPPYHNKFISKSTNNLINKTIFITGNVNKITFIKEKYAELYKELDIYGEFHKAVDSEVSKLDFMASSRQIRSLDLTSQFQSSLNIENNKEEGYAQASALWALRSMTPPILKSQPARKNFIRPECYIEFDDYIKMTKQERLIVINKVQSYLSSGKTYLTNLTLDYIEFFKDAFSPDKDLDLKKIAEQSQQYREKFIKI